MRGRLLTVCAIAVTATASVSTGETVSMVCDLRGGQEVPPVITPARGCGRFLVDTVSNTITYYIAFTPLASGETAAHFHEADPGVAGPVRIGLGTGNPKVGTVTYLEADEADILGGRWYVNIHSNAFGGGELRGQVVHMVADLTGDQENPPTGSLGTGWGLFTIDRCNNTLDYHIVVESLGGVESAAHIHGFALYGSNAGVAHPLPAGSVKTGSWTYSESQEAAIMQGRTYVNVHTNLFGGGEIRGQIVGSVNPINSAQEVPPNASTAFGCAMFAMDPANDLLSYRVFHNVIGETAAHIHGYAPPGGNAGVQHSIGVGPVKIGTWNYPAGDEQMIRDGLTYVNIHSAAFGGGEIRGQDIFPVAPCTADVNCDGTVNVLDFLAVLQNFGPCGDPCAEDTNGDGAVNVLDMLNVLQNFGPCP